MDNLRCSSMASIYTDVVSRRYTPNINEERKYLGEKIGKDVSNGCCWVKHFFNDDDEKANMWIDKYLIAVQLD